MLVLLVHIDLHHRTEYCKHTVIFTSLWHYRAGMSLPRSLTSQSRSVWR